MSIPELVPNLSAPSSTYFSAVSLSLTPPLALTFALSPTTDFINLTSSYVAPPVPKPVDVLTKSALATSDNSQALTFSSSVR